MNYTQLRIESHQSRVLLIGHAARRDSPFFEVGIGSLAISTSLDRDTPQGPGPGEAAAEAGPGISLEPAADSGRASAHGARAARTPAAPGVPPVRYTLSARAWARTSCFVFQARQPRASGIWVCKHTHTHTHTRAISRGGAG